MWVWGYLGDSQFLVDRGSICGGGNKAKIGRVGEESRDQEMSKGLKIVLGIVMLLVVGLLVSVVVLGEEVIRFVEHIASYF